MSSRRLKIAFVVHFYSKHHGHSRYVAELAERFAAEHEVHVYTNRVLTEAPPSIRFHHVPCWGWKSLTVILTFVIPATLRISPGFDIIHAQGLCGLRQNVTTAHMCQAAWYAALRRIQGRLSLRQRLSRGLLGFLEWLIYRPWISRRVIAISEANRRALATHYRRQRDVKVIYHGVDLERFHPRQRRIWRGPIRAELGLSEHDFVALYVGDLKKGAAAAIGTLARVPDARLVVVSPTPSGQWEQEAKRLGVGERVVFVAETTNVERYYAAADAFLFPTFHDAFGMVITEAMAAGLPVITSRSAGASELLEHGSDGLIADDAWDVPTLSGYLGRLCSDATLRESMGAAARSKAEQYTWDRTAELTMHVYRSLSSGNQPASPAPREAGS